LVVWLQWSAASDSETGAQHTSKSYCFVKHRSSDKKTNVIDRLKRVHKISVKMAFGSDSLCNLPGKKRADIIATPGSPLENIQVLRRVMFVMKDGKAVKHAPKAN
jgi:hypothetical protein